MYLYFIAILTLNVGFVFLSTSWHFYIPDKNTKLEIKVDFWLTLALAKLIKLVAPLSF